MHTGIGNQASPMMEAVCTPKRLVHGQNTTGCNYPEFYGHSSRSKNLKSSEMLTSRPECKCMIFVGNVCLFRHSCLISWSFEGVTSFRYLGTTLTIKTAFTKRLRTE
jgi:hypothetical protein